MNKNGSVSASFFLAFCNLVDEIIYIALVIFIVSFMLFMRFCISFVFAIILLVSAHAFAHQLLILFQIFLSTGYDGFFQFVGQILIVIDAFHDLRIITMEII